jgi:cyclic beta-1,2-glucan synthetase
MFQDRLSDMRVVVDAELVRRDQQQRASLAGRLLGIGGRPAESVAVVLFPHERAPLSDALAVQLVHRLGDQDPRITPALT